MALVDKQLDAQLVAHGPWQMFCKILRHVLKVANMWVLRQHNRNQSFSWICISYQLNMWRLLRIPLESLALLSTWCHPRTPYPWQSAPLPRATRLLPVAFPSPSQNKLTHRSFLFALANPSHVCAESTPCLLTACRMKDAVSAALLVVFRSTRAGSHLASSFYSSCLSRSGGFFPARGMHLFTHSSLRPS